MNATRSSTVVLMLSALGGAYQASAVTNHFFNSSQTATVVATNMTSVTIRSSGYLFNYSMDNWWSPTPGGTPTGRFQTVLWPNGVDAQTITAGPSGPLPQQLAATITLSRVDAQPFDLRLFTGKILGNTAGAGAAFEIMPQLNGQDALANPLTFDATGYAGNTFTYSLALAGYDTYIISLWMDFALTQLILSDLSLPPALQISTPSANQVWFTWPVTPAGYTLEQNSTLTTSNWFAVTNPVAVVGTNNQVTVPKQGANGFFRLILR